MELMLAGGELLMINGGRDRAGEEQDVPDGELRGV